MNNDITTQITRLEDASVTTPKGFQAGGLYCGIKKKRPDLGWLYSEVPAFAAGVYTTNLFQAAPIIVTKASVETEHKLQAIIVNSGNANACTGERGLQDAYDMRDAFAKVMGIKNNYAAVCSTGVIGQFLPMEKVKAGIEAISQERPNVGVDEFERAILTTDTCKKHYGVKFEIDGKEVFIGGTCKGSGMIHPNMATMLGYITTDANISSKHLQEALKHVTNKTFNQITVDGDTSTNDMVLLLANGLAGNEPLSPNHKDWNVFLTGLEIVSRELAKKIARDGEGATKLVEVVVKGATNDQVAQGIGKSVVGSSLVKTAIFGNDANWGRIVCAVGYSGQPLDPNKVTVSLGTIKVVENGLPLPFSEEDALNYLKTDTIQINILLGDGFGEATCWGCDLTYDYVKINGSYRT